MLNNEQIAFFKANGYVNGGKVLNDADVEELRAEIDRVIADDGKPDVQQPVFSYATSHSMPTHLCGRLLISGKPAPHSNVSSPTRRSQKGWRS